MQAAMSHPEVFERVAGSRLLPHGRTRWRLLKTATTTAMRWCCCETLGQPCSTSIRIERWTLRTREAYLASYVARTVRLWRGHPNRARSRPWTRSPSGSSGGPVGVARSRVRPRGTKKSRRGCGPRKKKNRNCPSRSTFSCGTNTLIESLIETSSIGLPSSFCKANLH